MKDKLKVAFPRQRDSSWYFLPAKPMCFPEKRVEQIELGERRIKIPQQSSVSVN